MPVTESSLRIEFFDLLFQDQQGWLCLATKNPERPHSSFKQKFFRWPLEHLAAEEFIILNQKNKDLYFCVNLLNKAERTKEHCIKSRLVWADLDEVEADSLAISPQIIIESSPGRFQALWRLSMAVEPDIAEQYSKRIAYSTGADKSGWDLTQLLRIPFTTNFKYKERPTVKLIRAANTEAAPLLFEALPPLPADETPIPDLPTPDDIPDSGNVVYKYTTQLRGTAFTAIWSQEPEDKDDWSKILWRLIHICLEAGMTPVEVFSVVKDSPVNKYARDERPITHLWRDISKAKQAQDSISIITANFAPLVMPQLVPEPAHSTFIDSYRDWAIEATDAVPQFHNLAAAILLSSVISNSVRVETSYGTMVPNLWGMVLGDSTLTRKTTAMRMVMDILNSIDSDMILATDGSVEGMLSGLETRPNRTSIFFRDELSGFFDAINRRDYLAGMPETFTALYDVPGIYQRRLRKEVIRIESPVFIFFGGGVRDKVFETLTEEYVISGFLPRFLVVSGDTDLKRLRRTGPASENGTAKRASIVTFIHDLYENYATEVAMKIGGQVVNMPPRIIASLTSDAWETYGTFEEQLVNAASESSIPTVALPTFERLSRSLLKLGIVLAASRQMPDKNQHIKVESADILNAAWYVQDWGRYSVELVMNTGKGVTERILDRIVRAVSENPGILRSTLMQHYHLTKKQADEILGTLEDRMLVRKEQVGRGWRYFTA